MPLIERLRIELFFPDSQKPNYPKIINRYENEMAFAFAGCSVVQGNKGLYRARDGTVIPDRIHLLFTDSNLNLTVDRAAVEAYVDELAATIAEQLNEEKILVAVYPVYHQTSDKQ